LFEEKHVVVSYTVHSTHRQYYRRGSSNVNVYIKKQKKTFVARNEDTWPRYRLTARRKLILAAAF
jgi:hypothetical protein